MANLMKIIVFFVFLGLIFSCDKLKLDSTPNVKITSITPSEVSAGNIVSVQGEYSDAEGDIDSIYVVRTRYDLDDTKQVYVRDTFAYQFSTLGVPDKTTRADFTIDFSYANYTQGYVLLTQEVPARYNSIGIYFLDKEKHKSEFVDSEPILLQ